MSRDEQKPKQHHDGEVQSAKGQAADTNPQRASHAGEPKMAKPKPPKMQLRTAAGHHVRDVEVGSD